MSIEKESLRKRTKQVVSQQSNGLDSAVANKQFWYTFYLDYFLKLITNYWEWENIPDSIDKLFIEKFLPVNGYLGMFKHPTYGFIVSRGALGSRLDMYDNPTIFRPVNNSNFLNFGSIKINWYTDNLDPEKAIIIQNNNYNSPSTPWLEGFCMKLAEIEQTIQLNRNAQIRPYVIITDDKTEFSMKNFFNKLLNQDPVIPVNTQRGDTGSVSAMQLSDRFYVVDTKTDFLLDKLHDEKQRVINQLLTWIGINNNAVDKAERLVSAEATSNNGLINASIQIMYAARKRSVERINKCWDLDINVRIAEQIERFNTEEIYGDINTKIDTETSEVSDDE